MNPKSGTPGSAIGPAKPEDAIEADNAEPGEVAELRNQQAQSDATPHREDETVEETHWIEIELVGEDDEPIPGESYEITLPDGAVAGGTLDQNGFARVNGIPDAGDCQITFPNLDKDAWEPA